MSAQDFWAIVALGACSGIIALGIVRLMSHPEEFRPEKRLEDFPLPKVPTADEIKAEREALKSSYPRLELPPFDPKAHCPKCRFEAVTTQWFPTRHEGCAERVLGAAFDAVSYWMGKTARQIAALQLAWEMMPEHLDRRCPNCRYGWAEAVAEVKS